MTEFGDLNIWGTLEGDDKSLNLDEISILAKAEVIRALGVFLINAAHEMDINDIEHVHLQNSIANFSYKNHVDVIVINQKKWISCPSLPDLMPRPEVVRFQHFSGHRWSFCRPT